MQLKLGQVIKHNGPGPRAGNYGCVAFAGDESDRVQYGIIWFTSLRDNDKTELIYYTSQWLANNVEVVAEPVRDFAIPAVGKWQEQLGKPDDSGYYCAVDGAAAPARPHKTLAKARTEAKRLGKATGKGVSVYQRVSRLEQRERTITTTTKEAFWK